MPGCWVRYDFDTGRTVASTDFYFRRNSKSAYQGVYFMVVRNESDQQIMDGASLNVWLSPEGTLHVDSDTVSDVIALVPKVATETNRWYHLFMQAERAQGGVTLDVAIDGVPVLNEIYVAFSQGSVFFKRIITHTAWWGPSDDVNAESSAPAVWWDDLCINQPGMAEGRRLYQTVFQQGLGYYRGNRATYFDGSSGYNSTNLLHVGANDNARSLVQFDLSSIPPATVIDEATLRVYYTGRSNDNPLTLGAHRVLAEWIDSEANRIQRKSGVNWQVAGMGSGSDYAAAAEATSPLSGAGGAWVELDVTNAVQAWVADAANNHGLVLLQEAAGGYVIYDFCSEQGWEPCTAAQAPRLTLRYHLAPPAPVKATFQRGAGGYTGNQGTYFDYSGGYNNTALLHVGADGAMKSLLRFDVTSIPAGVTVDEATLRLHYTGRSNSNSLTLAAHQVLLDWIDSQANRIHRQTGVNWSLAGMGAGSDYAAPADGMTDVLGVGGSWVELDVTDMVQAWVANPASNQGVVVLREAAGGHVTYDFCSELGWSPCTASQAPKLTVWYRP